MLRDILIAATLLLPAHAGAEEFCAPRARLFEAVCFCDENAAYAEQADACQARFRGVVQAKQKELTALFGKHLGARDGDQQNKQFQLTQKDYATTDAALVDAIHTGRGARQELVLYLDDVVPPHNYPLALRPTFPGLHHPSVQEMFRAAGCYRETMEGVERAITEMDRMISELEATRAKTAQLFKTSGSREAQLDVLKGLGAAAGTIAAGSGKSSNGASDVTGLREDRAKRGDASVADRSAQLQAPDFSSLPSSPAPGSAPSMVTGTGAPRALSGSANLPANLAAKRAPASARTPFSELQTQSRAFASAATIAPGIHGLKQEQGKGNAEAPANLAAAAVFADRDSASLSGVTLREDLAATRDPAPATEAEAQLQAGQDSGLNDTLFARVQRRYRASSLFRAP